MKKTREMTIPSNLKSLEPVAFVKGRGVFEDNPFVESFYVEVRQKSMSIAGGFEVKDIDKKDVKVGALAVFKQVDTEQFLKVYTQNVKALFELSPTAQKILMPLMLEIQKEAKNVAHLYFSHSIAKKNCVELGIKPFQKATFFRGLGELIEKDFLAVNAKGQNWYWINPSILFNGDRIRYVQEYRIKRKAENLQSTHQQYLLPNS